MWKTAKTGRAVIEKAETFHPDIVFMDIHMPGINGIQAMREIRKFNNSALFYVVSAYDKFDYAKEAINLGVEQYLTKPISKSKIISVVEEATAKVDKVRDQRSNLLKNPGKAGDSYPGCGIWLCKFSSFPERDGSSRLLPAAS